MNILVTGARAPIAADIAQALALSGHQVWVADSVRAPVGAASPFIRGFVRLPAPRKDFSGFVEQLRIACVERSLDAIVPTSEEVFWLARATSFLPGSVDVRTSAMPLLASLHHKGTFAKLASRLGYGALENHELLHREDLARFSDPTRFVFKPVYSRFATRTLVGPSWRELNRVQPTTKEPWLAQTRIHGREWCAYNVAAEGRLLLHVAYEPLFRIGAGASTYFSPVAHTRLRTMCERFIAATGFSGQISFDAIETDAGLVAIECNPRGTSGVHLAAQQPAALASALLGQHPEPTAEFFPRPRMLLLPLLLSHPSALFRSRERAQLRAGQDVLRAAGISFGAQSAALAAMTWQALRHGLSLPRASTADFEWNGEPMHG